MIKIIHYLGKYLSYLYLLIFYKVRIIGLDNVPTKGGILLCATHYTELDMFLIGHRMKRKVIWMAKEELFKNKIMGFIVGRLGAFPVKRGKADSGALKTAIKLIKNGEIVGIFPHGTRISRLKGIKPEIHNGTALIALKSGALLLPVVIKGNYKLFTEMTVIFGKPVKIENELLAVSHEKYEKISNMINDKFNELLEANV